MIRLAKKIARVVMFTIATVMLIAALALLTGRMLTPALNHHLPDLEALASDLFKKPVKIKSVNLVWTGIQPELILEHADILDPATQQPILEIQQVKINVCVWRSLLEWKLILDQVDVSGVELTVRQEAQGEFDIGGLYNLSVKDKLAGGAVKTNEILNWVFSQLQLTLNDIDIEYISNQGQEYDISLDHLELTNEDMAHSIQGQVTLIQEKPTRLQLKINWHGKVDDLPHASFNVYAYLEEVSLPQWFKQKDWHHWQIKEGMASAKIWADWKESAWQSIATEFEAANLVLYEQTLQQSRKIPRLSGQINWKREGDRQIISGEDILIDLPKHLWPTLDFSVTLMPNKDNQLKLKSFQINYLNLVEVTDWLQAAPLLPNDINQLLTTLKPQGALRQMVIDLPVDEPISLDTVSVAVQLDRVTLRAWNSFPSIQNLTGQLNWDKQQGSLKISSEGLRLNYPSLFEKDLEFDRAAGQLTFNKNTKENIWIVGANDLQVSNPDIRVITHFDVHVPFLSATENTVEKKPLNVNLSADFSVKNAAHLTTYLPLKSFSSDLSQWLKSAFVSGQFQSGKVAVQGNLHDFPFDHDNGKFIVSASAKNVDLNFSKDWPMLRQLNGDLAFEGKTITVDINSGLINDAYLKRVHTNITNIGTSDPTFVNVQGLIVADLAQGLYFIHHSPLEKKIGQDLDGMYLTGPMQLQLDLVVPLVKLEDIKVRGEVVTSAAVLSLPQWNLALENMGGSFQFTEDTLESKALRGRLLGEDAELSFATVLLPNKQKIVRANLQSQVQISSLQKWLNIPLSKVLQGTMAYQAQLDLASQNSNATKIIFKSDLKGITINAPNFYGKTAAVPRDFVLELFIRPEQLLQIKMTYGDLLTAAMNTQKSKQTFQLAGGEIHLGKEDVTWPSNPGIIITGKMDRFDWDVWKKYFDSLASGPVEKQHLDISHLYLRGADVFINQFIILGQQLNQVQVQLEKLKESWQISLKNKEMDGSITLPADSGSPMRADFKRLRLSSGMITGEKKHDPKTLPAFSLVCQDLRYDDKSLGQVVLDVVPNAKGLGIGNLKINTSNASLQASGDWRLIGNNYQTSLQGEMNTNRITSFLNEWGEEVNNLVADKGSVRFNLTWSDAPYHPTIASMTGTLNINIGKGRIIDLSKSSDTKLDIGRMLNILNLQTIPRRLSLDFSDLFQKGYSFDYIIGQLSLKRGNAYTDNIRLDGPVARVTIAGRIGLQAKDYDLNMTVTPYVTSSLPVVATIAGGPLAGMAAWVVDKVVSGAVSKVTSYHYRVTGPWSDPVWEKR